MRIINLSVTILLFCLFTQVFGNNVADSDTHQWKIVREKFVLKNKKWIGPEIRINSKYPFKISFRHIEAQQTIKTIINGTSSVLLLPKLDFKTSADASTHSTAWQKKEIYLRRRYWLVGTLYKNRSTNVYKLTNHDVLLDQVFYEKKTNANSQVYDLVSINGVKKYGKILKLENYVFTGQVYTFLRESSDNMKFSFCFTTKPWMMNKLRANNDRNKSYIYKISSKDYSAVFYSPIFNKKQRPSEITLQLRRKVYIDIIHNNDDRENYINLPFYSFDVFPIGIKK